MKVVRSSKFRNVFGTAPKKEHAYDGVKVSRSAWDSNKIKVNPKFVAVMWEASGGGAVGVIPLEMQGKISPNLPLITGHKAEVLDIDFNPYNDNLLASASEDTYVKIWALPDGGLKEPLTTPAQTLSGHRRKVGTTDFNPVAANVLATSSADLEVKVWDIEKGAAICTVGGHTDIIQTAAWSYDGSQVVTASKDKKVRLLDPRAGKVVAEVVAHEGSKGSRVLFLGKRDRLVSVGFSKNSSRQYAIWDQKSLDKPLVTEEIDTSAGLLMPFFDADLNILYLAGKGDGNIRYYEITDDDKCIYFLSEFKSATPQRGVASMPKRGCDVSLNEIAKMFKVDGQGKLIEGISFQVPRKGDSFQDDIFPDCVSEEAALSADAWKSGQTSEPKRRSMAPGFVAGKKPAEFKPQVVKEEEGPKNEKELRDEYEKLKSRVAYLESELVKRDARIKQLEGK
jgi:WD40 repeat protein